MSDPGWDQLGSRTSDEDYGAVLKRLKKRPIDYFRMFYADTAVFGAYDATVCGLNFFGADHVLFASDAPFDPERGPMYIRETIAILDRLPIAEADRERIYWRNAVELLKLAASKRPDDRVCAIKIITKTTEGHRRAAPSRAAVRRAVARRRHDGRAAARRQRAGGDGIRRQDQDAGRRLRRATSCIRRTAPHAAVLVWPDILGLRPAFRQMGKRLAESGLLRAHRESVLSHEAGAGRAGGRELLPILKCARR